MRKDHQSASSRHPVSLTIVTRSLVLLFIFSIAGSAAGSCLSYGHSCWGAHGKRSYNGRSAQQHRPIDNHRDGSLIAEVETDGNAPAPSSQDRWILSRLITGRLTVPAPLSIAGERHSSNRWYGTGKFLDLPGNWDTDYDSTRTAMFRDQKVETNAESDEDSKEFDDDPLDLARNVDKPHAETTNLIIVPSRREYDNRPSRTRRLKLLKILTDSSDDKLK